MKPSRNFATILENLVAIISQILVAKIGALHHVVSSLAKQNMSLQYLHVKKPLKMANDQRNRVVNVQLTLQLNYATIFTISQLNKNLI